MQKFGIAMTILNGLFFAGSFGFSPVAPPTFAQWVVTTFKIENRTDVSFASVDVMSPVAASDQGQALDLAPAPGTSPHPENGWSWFDACDHNPITNPLQVFCARMGINRTDNKNWAEFGYLFWDGAPTGGIKFKIGGTTVGEITIDPSNHDPVWTIKGRVKARGFDIIP